MAHDLRQCRVCCASCGDFNHARNLHLLTDYQVMLSEMVPGAGLEPTSLSARASKTLVSANFTTRAGLDHRIQIADFGFPNKRQIPTGGWSRSAASPPEPKRRWLACKRGERFRQLVNHSAKRLQLARG